MLYLSTGGKFFPLDSTNNWILISSHKTRRLQLDKFITFQLDLEVRHRLIEMECTLTSEELEVPSITKMKESLEELLVSEQKFNSLYSGPTNFDLVNLGGNLFSFSGNAYLIAREMRSARWPTLAAQVLGLILWSLGPTYCQSHSRWGHSVVELMSLLSWSRVETVAERVLQDYLCPIPAVQNNT